MDCYNPIVMGTVYSGVQHYFRILQFRYGGEEWGEMMIFPLHCYSTAAMPYMGAQGGGGGGTIVGFRLFLEKIFQVGFSSHYGGLFLHVVGLFSPCGGHKQGALSLCRGLCSP